MQQARPTNPTERRKYLDYIRGTMEDLFAENEFKEFVDRSSAAFMEVIRKFIREVSLRYGQTDIVQGSKKTICCDWAKCWTSRTTCNGRVHPTSRVDLNIGAMAASVCLPSFAPQNPPI